MRNARLSLALFAMACLAALSAPLAKAQAASLDFVETKAAHVAIIDGESGILLNCKDCETPMAPASMSKLMTMLVVAEQLKAGKITLQTEFSVSENAWRKGAMSDGSHMFLALNSKVKIADLIRGVVIVSANDACIVLAEGISGSEDAFVDLMNRRAQDLGLKSARFRNTTGLPDPDHLISAADLAKLARIIINEHPDLYRMYAERSLTFNGKTQENRNPLLGRFDGADGVKTGHTNASGYGMIGSAVMNGQRRIIVFNGLPTMAARASEAERLMRAAFFDFSVTTLADKGQKVGEAEVWLGGKKTVPLIAPEKIVVGAHRSVKAGLKAAIVYQGPLAAPIAKDAAVAKLVVEGPGFARVEAPLMAGAKVGRANWFSRAGAGIGALTRGS